MDKEKSQWRKKLEYSFDAYMEKGIKAQFGLLFFFFLFIVIVSGVLAFFFMGEESLSEGLWVALMHIIDQGTIAGDEFNNYSYLFIMFLVTVCGMVLTGSLIAIINNALDQKLSSLRQGNSEVLEEQHTVIVGFDENIYCLLSELINGNEDAKLKRAIIVIDEENDKETMDRLIANHVVLGKYTRIICRCGKLSQKNIYDQIGLCKAASIVINCQDDFQSLRILLAVTTYLHNRGVHNTVITSLFHEKKTIESAEYVVAAFPKARILYFEDMLARIIAQVCRQPGLSYVLSQVFGYAGSEFYIEDVDAAGNALNFSGEKFGNIMQRFSNTIVVGLERKEVIALNPPPDTIVEEGDKIIHLAVHSRAIVLQEPPQVVVDPTVLQRPLPRKKAIMKFLVLDWNHSISIIINSLDQFVDCGSSVRIVSDKAYGAESLAKFDKLKNIKVEFDLRKDLFAYETLRELLEQEYTNILIMCCDNMTVDESDARAAMLLLHLRTIINDSEGNNKYENVIITSEMNTADDQKLLQVANVNDFVVGSEITNRMMAQVANEPHLTELFEEILDAVGSEIYLRPAKRYIKPGSELSFDEVTAVVYNYVNSDGTKPYEILLGYKFMTEMGNTMVELNPRANGDPVHKFTEQDMLVVLSTGNANPFQA